MIAYRGDSSLAEIFAHGNAKIKTNFLQSIPSVKKDVKQRSNEIASVESLFIRIKANQISQRRSNNQELVRDPKQIANFRTIEKQTFIISPCQLTSIHLLSMYHLGDFVRFSNTIHEFYCVMAHPEAIKLANRLLKASEDNPALDQTVNYDTTFDIGEFYLSTLVIKNTHLVKDRIFPVAFFLHNRKDTLTHKAFFDWMFNEVSFPENVPFFTDREHSIVNNILGHSVGPRQLFYCTNHLIRNVKFWCQKKRFGKKIVDRYVSQVKGLI